ncbi:ankyrin repeat domain-containing protein [Bordetella tumulicola]|uniref:ankyrin repeat domain-containing protein n=1 Tax=Bordetella tumulicola TaxID=1649133 RepID=UPI0039EF8DF8
MTSFNPVRAAYNYVVGFSDQQNQEIAEKINDAISELFNNSASDLNELFKKFPDEVIAALKQRETPPLCEAVKKNLVRMVPELLKIIPSEIDTPNSEGFTPSMLAAKQGSDSLVRALLSGGADMQKVDATGCTALMWAVLSGIVELVRSLLGAGAGAISSVDVQNKDGNTALMLAVMNMKESGSDDFLKAEMTARALLDSGKVNVTLANKAGDTALGLMASQPAFSRRVAYSLYTEGADLSAQNHKGRAPIVLASRSGNAEAVRFLIEHMQKEGIDIDMKDNRGRTALYYATVDGNADIAKQLVHAGADLLSMDEKAIGELGKRVGADEIGRLQRATDGNGLGDKTPSIDASNT